MTRIRSAWSSALTASCTATSLVLATLLLLASGSMPVAAQDGGAAGAPAEPAPVDGATESAAQDDDDPDQDVNLAQPDFTIAALPTTLRMPKGKFAFRVTHRFSRPLDEGDVGDLVADFFGFDSGGLIGLELRYGLLKGTQIGVLRTSDRTIQVFAQQQVVAQKAFPVGVAVNVTVDGTNNFQDRYSPGIGLVVSRELGKVGAIYVEPIWVGNVKDLSSDRDDDGNAFLLGVGTRVRVSRRAYLVAEAAPRVAGDAPGSTHVSLGVEMRAGGHAFQLNVSRSLATTMGQVARGGTDDDWFIGFNISRKFW